MEITEDQLYFEETHCYLDGEYVGNIINELAGELGLVDVRVPENSGPIFKGCFHERSSKLDAMLKMSWLLVDHLFDVADPHKYPELCRRFNRLEQVSSEHLSRAEHQE